MEESGERERRTYRVQSTWGAWIISVGDRGVKEIGLPASPPRRGKPFLWKLPRGMSAPDRRLVRHLMTQLEKLFNGSGTFVTVACDLRGTTGFRRGVWKALTSIPFGQRRSYGDLARAIGSKNACRAVGGACAANPLPILFPCHRVVGKRGAGGFSAGPRWKKFLLEMEARRE